MAKKRFPSLWVIVLVFAIVWLIDELGYLKTNIPWLPVVIIIFVVGAIINRLVYE